MELWLAPLICIKSYPKELLDSSFFIVSFLSRLLPQGFLGILLIFVLTSYIFSSCHHKRTIWTHVFVFCER